MTWEEAEKFVASVLDRMEHESIQEAARRLLDLDATFAEMVAGVNTRDTTIAALRAENIRLRGEVDMYKGALEMMQPAPKEQAEHGMGAMPPVPDEVAQLRAEVERAKTVIENYELDYDRVVVRGEKCAMELAVAEAATLRAEVERLKADPRLTLRFSAGVIEGDKEQTLAACSDEGVAKQLASELSLAFGTVGFSHDHQKQADASGALERANG